VGILESFVSFEHWNARFEIWEFSFRPQAAVQDLQKSFFAKNSETNQNKYDPRHPLI